MFLSDLHIHSNFSDGKMTIPEIVDFYGKRKFGAIAVTDHICEKQGVFGVAASYLKYTLNPATFPLYFEILKSEKQRAWDEYNMVLIAGFEISKNSWFNHRSAHVLGLGVTEFLSADGDIEDILRSIRAQGALTIGAHPVSTRKLEKQTYHLWGRKEELAPLIDAWEVASGPVLFTEVLQSGLPMIANSDLHHAGQINSWKTLFRCERNESAIMDAIRKQQLEFHFFEDGVINNERPNEHSFCALGRGRKPAFGWDLAIA
jgi:hypothetical protein